MGCDCGCHETTSADHVSTDDGSGIAADQTTTGVLRPQDFDRLRARVADADRRSLAAEAAEIDAARLRSRAALAKQEAEEQAASAAREAQEARAERDALAARLAAHLAEHEAQGAGRGAVARHADTAADDGAPADDEAEVQANQPEEHARQAEERAQELEDEVRRLREELEAAREADIVQRLERAYAKRRETDADMDVAGFSRTKDAQEIVADAMGGGKGH